MRILIFSTLLLQVYLASKINAPKIPSVVNDTIINSNLAQATAKNLTYATSNNSNAIESDMSSSSKNKVKEDNKGNKDSTKPEKNPKSVIDTADKKEGKINGLKIFDLKNDLCNKLPYEYQDCSPEELYGIRYFFDGEECVDYEVDNCTDSIFNDFNSCYNQCVLTPGRIIL
ncbi:hypothetical protein K502DRAFT_358040 [Neoconidiobolus thromboides FSU 785]|nr:hypothetical protein K502DRAFT_358040 [Neoconidiobolus thromboides FSU 785]